MDNKEDIMFASSLEQSPSSLMVSILNNVNSINMNNIYLKATEVALTY
jgi:hypothetical protein